MVNEPIAALKNILDQLLRQFDQLQAVFIKERDAIRRRDADAITQHAKEAEPILIEIAKLDQQRLKVTMAIARMVPQAGEKPTLKALDKALNHQGDLLGYRRRLLETIPRVEKLNRENQAALRGIALATEAILSLTQDKSSTKSLYNRLGNRQSREPFHRFSKEL
ncbi:flagellar protein FlgN [Magnetococcales bacterium HHB-1]